MAIQVSLEENRPWPSLSAATRACPVVLIGGFAVPEKVAWLRSLGVEAEWLEAYGHGTRATRALATRVARGAVAGVVLLNALVGHHHADAVVAACKAAGVPFVLAGRGGQAALATACAELERRRSA